jgi:hypothetical protein
VTEFVAALDDTPEGQETLTPTVARDRRPGRWRWRLMGIAAAACVALGATGALWGRSQVLKLRSRYVNWATSEPAKPTARPVAPTGGELPDPPKPQSAAPTVTPPAAPALHEAANAPASPPPPSAAKPEPDQPHVETSPAHAETPPAHAVPEPAHAALEPAHAAPEPAHAAPEPAHAAPEPAHAAPARTEPAAHAEPARTEPAHAPAPAAAPSASRDVRAWREQIDGLIADGKVNVAKGQLRDRVAVDKSDAWSHLRLGDIYADPFHYRRDAYREWDSALALVPALKSDAHFRKSVCETVDTSDRAPVEAFFRAHFDADESAALLLACVRASSEPARIQNASQLIEAIGGAERPELGMAAMRLLDVGKSCAQKKAAVETIGRLHYIRARGALVKLDRQRLAQKSHPTAAVACFGTTIADTIERLK